jgi:hypothetical protein
MKKLALACGPLPSPTAVSRVLRTRPTGRKFWSAMPHRVIANMVGAVWITVRDLNTAGDCFDAALVAEGWGKAHYTDNDEYGTLINNTNALGYMADGELATPAGATVQYSGNLRFTYSSDKGLRIVSRQVNVH